jgi:parallel beta-helix repeat protein
MHLAILLLFFSCNKTCLITPQPEQQVIAVSTPIPLTDTNQNLLDTLIPDNAVSVRKFGAIGNGVNDDTNALQTALNSETTLVIPPGVYIINRTLNFKPNCRLYGSIGAIVKTGKSMKGTLLTLGRYFYLNNSNNCIINNIRFQQSSQSFKFSNWGNACIYLENSANAKITYSFFDFKLPYSNSGFVAVWVGGSGSRNTIIKGNRLISAGIEYAENGAGGTIVDGNHISNSPANGLVAHGNTSEFCTGNVIINNTIENAGYMGIEDWGNVDGTVIRNNTINGTGKNPANSDGIGISAVGVNTQVVHNSIKDAQLYYIEVAGNGNLLVDGNFIFDTKKQAMGIIINFTGTTPTISALKGTIIKYNTINNCYKGIAVEGDNTPNVEIIANNINDPLAEGINIDSASPANFAITIKENNILFNTPNKDERKAVQLYSSLAHGAGNQSISLINNVINYAPTASGGPGFEFGVEVGIDHTVLEGNKINGNNIMGANVPVKAITANGASTQDVTFINNIITGGIVELTDFTIKTQSANSF